MTEDIPCIVDRTLQSQGNLMQDDTLVTRVAASLSKSGLSEQAGDLWEKMGQRDKALECYRKGAAFARAVNIARSYRPAGMSFTVWSHSVPYPFSGLVGFEKGRF
jgi:intraflagellar transport protein 172